MPLGIYISVPFCRTKCSYCNFASDVFSRQSFERYVDYTCKEITNSQRTAEEMGGKLERSVDSIYFGGGTPTMLEGGQLERIFNSVRQQFDVTRDAEITIECAPGTLSPAMLQTLLRCDVNRVSLGVQSFVDQEAAAVGRLHKRSTVLDDIARLRDAGIVNINIDLIAGLPHQNAASWEFSLAETIVTDVPHVSVYMLEIDDESRLGRELIAGGTRYHAHYVPDEDLVADFYLAACERLQSAGIVQYEISNFARPGFDSKHNLKYWTRQPYLGFGVDAHSMLLTDVVGRAIRFSIADSMEKYFSGSRQGTTVSPREALEEKFFLGLRLNLGVNLHEIAVEFGEQSLTELRDPIAQSIEDGLLFRDGDSIRLTTRGRLLSNEVFQNFLSLRGSAA
jgi:oxygen-independent coproporphyrinogen III oxidase